jgi:hypothetical protein
METHLETLDRVFWEYLTKKYPGTELGDQYFDLCSIRRLLAAQPESRGEILKGMADSISLDHYPAMLRGILIGAIGPDIETLDDLFDQGRALIDQVDKLAFGVRSSTRS